MRILLLTAYLPSSASGVGQRTALLHNALQQIGDITTLLLREGETLSCNVAPAPGIAAQIGYPEPHILLKYQPVPSVFPLVRSVLDVDDFDIVVSRYVGPLSALPPFRGRIVVDADDAYYRYPSGPRWYSDLQAALKCRARASRGRRVLRRVDHSWFSCQRDFDLFSLPSASILPNVVAHSDVSADSIAYSEPVALMVGLMSYRPNRDAAEWFIRNCWSEIRRMVPEARLRIVGAAPDDWLRQWNSVPGVECAGFVDDLVSEYVRARLTVVPVRTGGGSQIKVLESLSHGRVPIVSSFVATGYAPHLTDGDAFYVADDSGEQIKRVTELLVTPTKGEAIARRGQEIVRNMFCRERFLERVASSLTPFAKTAVRDRRR